MNLNKRVEKIEEFLNIGKNKPPVLVIMEPCRKSDIPAGITLPEKSEDWLTYKERITKDPDCTCMILNAEDEIEARRRLQGVTISNGNREYKPFRFSVTVDDEPAKDNPI